MTEHAPDRRTDLDWLRIAAFALLILYHVGMFYVTWDWHVKSSRASDAIEPLMLIVNPWRLLLLFIISGAATRFMADKLSAGALAGSRLGRLIPPLVLAMIVIVPPQTYFQLIEAGWVGSWSEFYVKYVTASGHWCRDGECLITPTYNHMWFVAYLAIYTLVLIALMPLLRRAPAWLGKLISGPGLFLTPWLFLFIARVTLFPIFDETHALVDDWYLHTVDFTAFLFGFAIAKHEAFFRACANWRFAALALALAAYGALMTYYIAYDGIDAPDALHAMFRGVREMQAWAAILAAFGFAYRHWRGADGPVRRFLTEAIFPFYLVHQTVIVVAGHYLDPLQLPLWLEASLLIGVTVLACWGSYELAKRVHWLRPWFGLRSRARAEDGKNPKLTAEGTV
jgi:glucan biosynthesis protein C